MNELDALSEAPAALRARLYSALHAGNQGDVEFYLRACKGARKVLEYGCGSGRIALCLAERGHTVIGVDLDSALLQLARERQSQREAELGHALPVEFIEGDMTTFSKRGCDRVLIPYSALWCLIGTQAKRKCLRKARASLTPGGQLVFDVYDADVMAEDDDDLDDSDLEQANSDDGADRANTGVTTSAIEPDDYEELHRIESEGVTYRVWERNTWDPVARLMQVDYRLVPARLRKSASQPPAQRAALRCDLAPRRSLPSGDVSRGPKRAQVPVAAGFQLTLRHSVLWRHELAALLDECGFEVEWGVDEAGETTPFAEQVIVRAVR